MVHVVPDDEIPTGVRDLLTARERLSVERRTKLQAILDEYEALDGQLRRAALGYGVQFSRELGHADQRVVLRCATR